MSLERRYRRLLRAYPAAYRARRGDEIVGTYLELASPDRSWPAPGEVLDMLQGGLRERVRASGAEGVLAGLHVAAGLALCASAFLATWLLLRSGAAPSPGLAPSSPGPVPSQLNPFGPFATLGVLPDVAWILAALAAVHRSARMTRILICVALVLTVTIDAVATLTGHLGVPLLVLIPQFMLGLLALALPGRRSWWVRLAPTLAVAAVAVEVLTDNGFRLQSWYPGVLPYILQPMAETLVAGTLLAGLGYAFWRDGRVMWAALMLFPSAALAWTVSQETSYGPPRFQDVAVHAALIGAASALAITVAVKLSARRGGPSPAHCPARRQPLPGASAATRSAGRPAGPDPAVGP